MVELMAYAVDCPPGHEFEYMVFADLLEAQDKAEEFWTNGYETEVIPLYSREPITVIKVLGGGKLERCDGSVQDMTV